MPTIWLKNCVLNKISYSCSDTILALTRLPYIVNVIQVEPSMHISLNGFGGYIFKHVFVVMTS